jgi:hypothetical protein
MIKTFSKLFLFATILIFFIRCNDTRTYETEGAFYYTSKFNDTTQLNGMDSMFIGKSIFSFKGEKSRYDFISIRQDTIIIMYNEKTHKYAVLVNREGQCTAFVNPHLNLDSMNHKRPKHKFEYLNDSKIIADYHCKKAETINKNEKKKRYIYYTKDIKAPLVSHLELSYYDLKGYPMEFNQFIDDKELITTITKVKFKYINEDIFRIPDNYKIEYTH